MQSMEDIPQREEPTGPPVEEQAALQLSGPQVGVAVASYGRSQTYGLASRLATASLFSGVASAVAGFSLFSIVYFRAFFDLFPGGAFLSLLFFGGLWVCLA